MERGYLRASESEPARLSTGFTKGHIVLRAAARSTVVDTGRGEQFEDDIFQIKLDLLSDLSVITVHGEVDLSNSHTLEENLNQLNEALPLLLDFMGVRYMDSVTAHLLFRVCERYDTGHARIVLAANGVIQRSVR